MPGGSGEVPPALCLDGGPGASPAHGPFGSVQFVATVGVSINTLARMRSETTGAIVETVKTENPLLPVGEPDLVGVPHSCRYTARVGQETIASTACRTHGPPERLCQPKLAIKEGRPGGTVFNGPDGRAYSGRPE